MPAISDLLAVSGTTATTLNSGDGFLISQSGISKGITWATMLGVLGTSISSGISIPSRTLMGRASSGTGAYEALTPSANFVFSAGALSLTGVPLVANDLSEYTGTAGAARTNLGLGTIAVQNAAAVALTGGTVAGIAVTGGSIDSAAIGANTPSTLRGTTLALTASQLASYVLAAPTGSAGAPAWRMLTTADVTGAESTANKGAAGGYAPLDGGAKVPLGNLPATAAGALHYLGTWNAATNTPSLTSGTAPAGDTASAGGFYVVNTAGTTLVNGLSIWGVGDWIVWTGSAWNKVGGAGVPVVSVAGRAGVVTLSNADISGLGAAALLSVGAGLASSGGAIVASFGTASGTVAQGNDTRIVFALLSTNNLSELSSNANVARGNLGIGTIATQAASAVALTGGTINGVTIGGTSAAAVTATTLALTASQSASYVHAAPTGSAGAPTWRMLTTADVTGAESTTNKGAASGYAPLDSSGKVPLANIPSSVVGSSYYLGVWNASTNTPTITSSTAPSGYGVGCYYVCNVAGTTAINGISTWAIGDWIIWSGSVWNKIDGAANPVSSVAGRQGAVVLTYADISGLGAVAQLSIGAGLENVSAALAINFGTTSGTAAQGNDARITGALQAANALSELSGSAATARTNLGLGSVAIQSAAAVALTGGSAAGIAFTAGTINGTAIGGTTPAAITGTTLALTSSVSASYAHIAPTGSAGAPTWRQIVTADVLNAENTTNKGAAGGYAPLDGSQRVPLANLPATVTGALHYLGTWNATSNSPALASSTAPAGDAAPGGGFYVVATAGTTAINGLSTWGVGDWIVWTGTTWVKQVGESNPVSSVAGRAGAVTLSSTDIGGLAAAALLNVGTGLASSGGSIVVNFGTTSGTAAQGNDSRITGALQASNALSELSGSAATARTNLGLGTLAVQGSGSVAFTGGTINGTTIGASSAAAITGTTLALTASQSASYVLAAPTTVAGAPTWRQLAAADVSGLGGSALLSVGTASGTVAAGNDSRITGALQTSAIPNASLLGGTGSALAGISINGTLKLSGGTLSFLAVPSETSTTRYEAAGGAVIYESDTTRFTFFDGTNWHYVLRLDGDTMTGALTVPGITNTGSQSVTGSLTVSGSSILAALSGTNGTFSGTLGVTGAATLGAIGAASLTVSGSTGLASLSATTAALSGNATVGGTLGVTGTATLGTVNSGNHAVTGTLSVSGAATLAALSGTSGTFSGTLGVTGAATLSGLTATTATFSSTVQLQSTLAVTGASTLAAIGATNGSFSGTLGVSGTATLGTVNSANQAITGTLGVTGATTLAALSATSGTFSGTLGVTGAATMAAIGATNGSFSGTVHVTGAATLASGANLSGVTSGYATAGLTIGANYAGNSESDLMVGAAGLNIYAINSSGVPSSVPILSMNSKGQLISVASGQSGDYGENIATLDMTGGRVNMLKQITSTQTNTPTVNVQLSNSSPLTLASYGLYPQLGALAVAAYGLTGGTASLDALIASINVYGNSPFTAQDVAIQSTVNQYGHDSTWGIDIDSTDYTGEVPGNFAQVGIEVDLSGNGPDAATSQYDCLHTYRIGLWICPGTQQWLSWAATTAYHTNGSNTVGSVIQMTNSAGVLSIYKCTTAGTSNSTAPTSWPTTGTLAEASPSTVVWTYQQAAAYQLGRGIMLNGYGDNGAYFGSGFSTNASFTDAVIDMSEGTLLTSINANAAGIRMAQNMTIDFTGNGTSAGQNLHTLGYGSFGSSLYYNVSGANFLRIADTGTTTLFGVTRLAASSTLASLNGVTTGYLGNGMTVGINYSGGGETDLIIDQNGVQIFAVQSGGTLSSALFTLDGSGNATVLGDLSCGGEAHFGTLSGGSGSLHGMATFSTSGGLLVGSDYTGVAGETDFLVNTGGLNVYAVQSGGTLSSALFTLDGSGNVSLAGSVTVTQHLNLGHYTVSGLPSGVATGAFAWASNGRKVGQGAGTGTGVPVYYDGSWRRLSDDTVVAS